MVSLCLLALTNRIDLCLVATEPDVGLIVQYANMRWILILSNLWRISLMDDLWRYMFRLRWISSGDVCWKQDCNAPCVVEWVIFKSVYNSTYTAVVVLSYGKVNIKDLDFLCICAFWWWWEGCVGFEKLIQKFGFISPLCTIVLGCFGEVALPELDYIPRPAGKSTRTDGCRSSYAKLSKLPEFQKLNIF